MKEKLLAILSDIRPDVEFENETQLIDNGVLDSFDIISIMTALEEQFGIAIDMEDLEPDNFNSVDAMIALIQEMKN